MAELDSISPIGNFSYDSVIKDGEALRDIFEPVIETETVTNEPSLMIEHSPIEIPEYKEPVETPINEKDYSDDEPVAQINNITNNDILNDIKNHSSVLNESTTNIFNSLNSTYNTFDQSISRFSNELNKISNIIEETAFTNLYDMKVKTNEIDNSINTSNLISNDILNKSFIENLSNTSNISNAKNIDFIKSIVNENSSNISEPSYVKNVNVESNIGDLNEENSIVNLSKNSTLQPINMLDDTFKKVESNKNENKENDKSSEGKNTETKIVERKEVLNTNSIENKTVVNQPGASIDELSNAITQIGGMLSSVDTELKRIRRTLESPLDVKLHKTR